MFDVQGVEFPVVFTLGVITGIKLKTKLFVKSKEDWFEQ